MASGCLLTVYCCKCISNSFLPLSKAQKPELITALRVHQGIYRRYNSTHCIKVIHYTIVTIYNFQNCFMEFLFNESFSERHIISRTYNPMNTLYFCNSQPCFHSCPKLHGTTPWSLAKVYSLKACEWDVYGKPEESPLTCS